MAQEDRRRVLDMLAAGKITADEAERLLQALGRKDSSETTSADTLEDKVERAVDAAVRAVGRVGTDIEEAIDGVEEAVGGSKGDRREKSFKVQGSPVLIVENFNGRVEVTGDSPDGAIRVVSDIRHPDLVEYSAVQNGDTILISAKPSGKRTFLGWRFLSRGANIRISSPPKAEVNIQNSNGRAKLWGIEGVGTLRSSNGRVEAEAVSGKFNLSTSNSRVEANRVAGDFRIESSNGRITIIEGQGTFDAQTSNGSIRFAGELLARKDSRFVTSNGSITTILRGEPSLRVNATTSNGSVTCKKEMKIRGTSKKRRLEGVLGDGEGALTLKTSNGSISIE